MDIEERLRTAPTEEDVLAYLGERSRQITDAGGQAAPVEVYWRPGDLDKFLAARAVWAEDAPPRFALDLPALLNGIAGPVGSPQTTFTGDLTRLWEGYAWWMQSEGRDPMRPRESREERRARVARESMARTRARRRGDAPELEEAKRLYDAYIEACRARREALARLDDDVSRTWAAYKTARDAAKG